MKYSEVRGDDLARSQNITSPHSFMGCCSRDSRASINHRELSCLCLSPALPSTPHCKLCCLKTLLSVWMLPLAELCTRYVASMLAVYRFELCLGVRSGACYSAVSKYESTVEAIGHYLFFISSSQGALCKIPECSAPRALQVKLTRVSSRYHFRKLYSNI